MHSLVKNEHFFLSPPSQPIYTEGQNQYKIDSCLPQKKAMQEGRFLLHAISSGYYPGTLIPPEALPGLCSLGFWNSVGKQNWGLELHRNEGIEIILLEKGEMPCFLDGKKMILKAGHFTVTRPWQKHSHGYPQVGSGRLHWFIIDVGVRRPNDQWNWPSWIQLQKNDLQELTAMLRENESPIWPASTEMIRTFQSLSHHVQHPLPEERLSHIGIAVNQLLLETLESLRQQKPKRNPELSTRLRTVDLFLKDLESHPSCCAEPWTLSNMAKQCGMGSTAFVNFCNQLTNTSPMNFLKRCRLRHAAEDLSQNPSIPITEIAFKHGFSTSQYFATEFKHQFRHSPRSYQAISSSNRFLPSDD